MGWCCYYWPCSGVVQWQRASTHPLRVLVGPDEQVDDSRQGPVLSERGVVGWAQGQVSDQTDHGLDQGPATRGVQ